MSDIPELKSRDQITGELINGFLSRQPAVNDLNRGAVLLSFLEAVGQSNFKAYADIITMIDALSIDRAVGEALRRLAADRNVPILPALAATGRVNITDNSFQKISTTIYAGQPAPVAGSTVIYVTDASRFKTPPPNGQLYIGRGTSNVEGPLTYTAITPQAGGAYWKIDLLGTTPTSRFHNINESVVMAQGGVRSIPAGTLVQTPSAGSSVSVIKFNTTAAATIIDGETTVNNVPVIAQVAGTDGNIPRGAIATAEGLPFQASAFNEQPFTNGRAEDTDDQIRDRIKSYEQAKSKGTDRAIVLSSIDVVSPDDLKRVTSAKVVSKADNTTDLVFDDGTGYEAPYTGIGLETVVDSAIGGETELQLRQFPVAQARLVSQTSGPYSLFGTESLSVKISGNITTHSFSPSDFRVLGSATAAEIAASINGDPSIGFLATTANGNQNLVIYPRDSSVNDIQIASVGVGQTDANEAIGLSIVQEFTLRLYKNDTELSQDGSLARISTLDQPSWLNSISDGDTLIYSVDGTPPITATFTLAAFQAINPTAIVSSSTPIDIWVSVINSIMSGVTATVNGQVIDLTSNLGRSNGASLEIIGGTLLSKMFSATASLQAVGKSADYELNRMTGQLTLDSQLQPGDKITAGSSFTRARVQTLSIPNGSSAPGRLWFCVDGSPTLISSNIKSTTAIQWDKTISSPLWKLTLQSASATPEGLDDARIGDWLLFWVNTTDSVALRPYQVLARIIKIETISFGAGTARQITVQADVASGTSSTGIVYVPADRFVCIRTSAPIQRCEFGVLALNSFVSTLKSSIDGIDVDLVGSAVRISSKTLGPSGDITVVAADTGGRNLGLPLATTVVNIPSHQGYVATADTEAGTPLFTYSSVQSVSGDTQFIDTNFGKLGGGRGSLIDWLPKYDTSSFTIIPESNRDPLGVKQGYRTLIKDFTPSTSTAVMDTPVYMKTGSSIVSPGIFDEANPTVQTNDRYFLRSPYQLDSTDSATIIVDGDAVTKSYLAKASRALNVDTVHATPTNTSFSATDAESSLALNNPASFKTFDFSDFKAWRRANTTLSNSAVIPYSVKLSAAQFGPSGNKIRVGFTYPSSLSQTSIGYTVAAKDIIDINLILPVATPRTPNWSGKSAFTVSVVSSGNSDTATYTWRVGQQPDFVAAGVVAGTNGDVAIINSLANFATGNKGFSGIVTGVTPTTFSIKLPKGSLTSDSLSFNGFINQYSTQRLTTLTTATAHNASVGDQIGLWNTAEVTTGVKPFDTTYTVLSTPTPTSLIVATPNSVPGGIISSVVLTNNRATVTKTAHGLYVNNVIRIDGAGSPYDGLAVIRQVVNSNSFRYLRSGSSGSVTVGRVEFQSYGPGTNPSYALTSMTKNSSTGLVTVTASNSFSAGDVVSISGSTLTAYVGATTYAINDIVSYGGVVYQSLSNSNTGNQPDISPTKWANIDSDYTPVGGFFNGTFIVDSATGSQFTFYHDLAAGNATGTGGTAVKWSAQANLARCVGVNANLLSFGSVSTTAQEVVDYVTTNMSKILTASLTAGSSPSAIINRSTSDLDESLDYIVSSTWSSYNTFAGSRMVEFIVPANTLLVAGSELTFSASSATDYDGTYTIIKSVTSGGTTTLTVATDILASTSASISVTGGTYYGTRPYRSMTDGENYVLNNNFDAISGTPMINLKDSWDTVPTQDEEIRLVAYTTDHIVRLWNQLIVTGLSNVGGISNVNFNRNIQLNTNTFGATGSIQVAGGTANSSTVAIVGSAQIINNRTGEFKIPVELLNGINSGFWMKLDQTVRSNKRIGFDSTSKVQLVNGGGASAVLETVSSGILSWSNTGTTVTLTTSGAHGLLPGANIQVSNLTTSGLNAPNGQWVAVAPTSGSTITFISTVAATGTPSVNAQSSVKSIKWPGSFQTKRMTTQKNDTCFAIERHGNFLAFIRQSGTALNASLAGVREGDWVRIANTLPIPLSSTTLDRVIEQGQKVSYGGQKYVCISGATVGDLITNTSLFKPYTDWSYLTSYSANDYALFNSRLYKAVSSNSNAQPDLNPTIWKQKEFSINNTGIYKVVRVFGEDAFWVEISNPVEEITEILDPTNLSFYSFDSAMPGDQITVSTLLLDSANVGQYTVMDESAGYATQFPSPDRVWLSPAIPVPNGSFIGLGNEFNLFNLQEAAPLSLWKRVLTASAISDNSASVVVDSPELMDRISVSFNAYLTMKNKLGFNSSINYGIDGYKSYQGLVKELQRVIYGDPTSPSLYPGVRAAGTALEIKPATIRRITDISISVRLNTGIPFAQVRDKIKAAVAAYINSLGVGAPVSLSSVISAASSINGVTAVSLVSPTYNSSSDRITVGSSETAKVIDSTTDITVSLAT